MNCKLGDLAYIVSPGSLADGMIVRCEKYLGNIWIMTSHGPEKTDVWEFDRSVPSFAGSPTRIGQDDCLRPIRDPGEDAEDETLTWLSVPAPAREVVHG